MSCLHKLEMSMNNFNEFDKEDRMRVLKKIMECLDEWEIMYHNTVVFNYESREFDGLGYWTMLIDQKDFKQLHVSKKLDSINVIVGYWINFDDVEQIEEADIIEVVYSV